MKFEKLSGCMILLLVALSQSAVADSPVWKVEKGDNALFIGGTIHVLAPSDYPLPPAFEEAYRQSGVLVFETDIQGMLDPEFQQEMLSEVVYPDGQSLKTALSADTYKELEDYLSGLGIPVENIAMFKAGMASMTLTMIELQRLGMAGAGVDEFFSSRAVEDQKPVGGLETPQEQLAMIAAMGAGQEDQLMAYTLRDIKELPAIMSSLKAAWRSGDSVTLREVFIQSFKTDSPELYEELLVKRNNAWVPEIEAMLQTTDVEFVLVGAAHLVGEDGVLAQLQGRGYKLRML